MLPAICNENIDEFPGGWPESQRIGCDFSQKFPVSPLPADGDDSPQIPFYITDRDAIVGCDIQIHFLCDGKQIVFVGEGQKDCSVKIMISPVCRVDSEPVNQL